MALVETQANVRGRVRHGTKKVASLAPHGGGRVATPAVRGVFAALLRAFESSVWAPVVLKALAVFAGMLALAVIGASSIARGSGARAPAPTAKPSPTLARAGVTPFAEAVDAGATPSDAGATLPDSGSDAGKDPSPALTSDGKVVLNRAGIDELRRIPGVGPKRAQAIVDLRTKLGGRFKRLTDLLRVKGIGPRSLKKMEAHVVLDAS
jgi:competence protein ComEA